jgi:hypothetical protein
MVNCTIFVDRLEPSKYTKEELPVIELESPPN